MPTRLPHLASASARFTATVVLPTPPLPAPTAMTFFTPGSGGWPVSGADDRADLRGHLHVDVAHAGQRAHRRARLVAHLVLDRARGCRQLDGERHAPVVDGQVLDEAERDDVAAEVRIDDDAQRVEDRVAVERCCHEVHFTVRPT